MSVFVLPHLVVIEGVDGVGKTTLAKRFRRELGYKYIYSVPGPFETIRKQIEALGDIEARFWYYLAGNVMLQRELKRILASGNRIVLDRYLYSTMASHQAMGATVACVDLSRVPYIVPDLAILLTCAPEVRNKRILSRGLEKEEYLKREGPILDTTEQLLRNFPLQVIDTTNINEEEVFAEVQLLFLAHRRET